MIYIQLLLLLVNCIFSLYRQVLVTFAWLLIDVFASSQATDLASP